MQGLRSTSIANLRSNDGSPTFFSDLLASFCSHGFQHLHLKLVVEPLHLNKVDDVFHVCE